ncbi:hypothetical protein JCM10207_000837 [Rhodosporidiobolus poonsookiae]
MPSPPRSPPPPSSSTPSSRLAAVSRHLSTTSAPSSSTPAPTPPTAANFRFFLPFQTRWSDNDAYGHVNNVAYSLYFDSVTNYFLLNHTPLALLPPSTRPRGLIVHSSTHYAAPLSYPAPVVAALAIRPEGRLKEGGRSVEWTVGLFEGEYVDDSEGEVGEEAEKREQEQDPEARAEQGKAQEQPAQTQAQAQSLQHEQEPKREAGPRAPSSSPSSSPSTWTLTPSTHELHHLGLPHRRVRLRARADGRPPTAAAWGTMRHVFVDPVTGRAVRGGLGDGWGEALGGLEVPE